jgi:phasin family protein
MDADTQQPAETVTADDTVVEPAKAEAKTPRKAKARRKPQVRAKERNQEMTKQNEKIFGAFTAFPGATAFEKLFTEASVRGEEAVKRSRKAAEEIADLYRGNLDAFVEAGKIAATGAQSIGQDLATKSRDSLEQTANTVRSFAEAKSPTELLQLQSDFARTAFDRFVEDSSALTESFVKLAGEAFQPLSNRASANVEKLNQIAA